VVVTAQRGGTLRESLSIAKSYTEARQDQGDSELLDQIASAKPELERTRHHSLEELKADLLERIRKGAELVQEKASPAEVAEYKRFVLNLGEKVANAHREGFLGLRGERVSDAERAALAEIAEALAETGSSDG
jgi:hypothetical protein